MSRQVVADEGIDCDFRRVANYTYAESDESLARVRDEATIAAELGLPATFTTDVPLPFEVKGAVRFDNQAQMHSVKYVHGLAHAVHGNGSHVFEQTRAEELSEGTPCVITVENGKLRARDVIVATNVPFLDRGLFFMPVLIRTAPTSSPEPAAPNRSTPRSSAPISRCARFCRCESTATTYVLTGGRRSPRCQRQATPPSTIARSPRSPATGFPSWRGRLSVVHPGRYPARRPALCRPDHPDRQTRVRGDRLTQVGPVKWHRRRPHPYRHSSAGDNPWAKVFNSNRITPAASAAGSPAENSPIAAANRAANCSHERTTPDSPPARGRH